LPPPQISELAMQLFTVQYCMYFYGLGGAKARARQPTLKLRHCMHQGLREGGIRGTSHPGQIGTEIR